MNFLACRAAVFPILMICVSSCAAHNTHLVRLDFETDLGVLARAAVDRLVADHGRDLSFHNTLLAVDVDEVDVTWDVVDGEHTPWTNEQLRDELEFELVERMGDALASAPVEGDYWIAGEYLLQARMVLDLYAYDALSYQIAAFLVHREDPERVIAYGLSDLRTLPRAFCHGCRDHPFRNKGTRVRLENPVGSEGHGYGIFIGTSFGYSHGYGGFGHSGGATYRTTR